MVFGIILAVIIGIGLFLLFVMQLETTSKYGKKSGLNKAEVREKWQNVESTFALGGPSNFKSAIMDADKLVDFTLASKVKGETMGARLKNAKRLFKDYNDYNNLWFAHKVRNNVAHEMNHELNSAEAKRAMEYFRKALKELGAI